MKLLKILLIGIFVLCGSFAFAKVYNHSVVSDYIGENISIYFIDGFNYNKPSSDCRTSACKSLLNEINNSENSIYFAIYGIEGQDEIFKALLLAEQRGVDVRGVTDMTQNNVNIYADTKKLIDELKTMKTDYEIADKNVKDSFDHEFDITAAIMHNKFFVFDCKKVFTGSVNISSTGTGGYNTNIGLIINSEKVAQLYTEEFEQMYSLKFHTIKHEIFNNKNIKINDNTNLSVYFAPKNQVFRTDLHNILNNAKNSIYIEMFYLTNKNLINDLIEAQKRGVDVKVILDASSAQNEFSGHNKLQKAGIPVKIENWGGKMHTKSASIDDKYFVIGSMNWTGKAEFHNDENLLIIENSEISLTARKHFEYMWDIIPAKYLKKIPLPEGKDSINSCIDGLDNDHNGKKDKDDPNCNFFYK